jgi:hypothetical protein
LVLLAAIADHAHCHFLFRQKPVLQIATDLAAAGEEDFIGPSSNLFVPRSWRWWHDDDVIRTLCSR